MVRRFVVANLFHYILAEELSLTIWWKTGEYPDAFIAMKSGNVGLQVFIVYLLILKMN